MGIHYDYKSTRNEKAMKKEAKRKARIEERRARKGSDSQTNDEKRKSSLKRARHLGYVLFFLILALFVVSFPFQKNVLIIFPELGLIYEGVKPIYNLLFK